MTELRRAFESLDMDAHVKAVVSQAPPLTPAQQARLRSLLKPEKVTRADREILQLEIQDAQVQDMMSPNPQRDMGHIYVVAFSTGVVKVGKTTNPHVRVNGYHGQADRIGGYTVTGTWVSEYTNYHSSKERELINACALTGHRKGYSSEFFTGLDFEKVVGIAKGIARGDAAS